MNYKSYKDLGDDVYANIHKLQGQGYDLVVGIPRSGMIPAYMIALLLNVYCVDIDSFVNNSKLVKGSTRKSSKFISSAWDAEKILLVDDSLRTGNSMQEAMQKIRSRVSQDVDRLAIYVEESSLDGVDIYFEIVPGPRFFQWNLFHHPILERSCLELEGVLCVAPSEEELQEESKYNEFLSTARPLVLPTYKIQTILTSRPERYREQTETWLNKNNIEFEHLVMNEAVTSGEERPHECYAIYKADRYRASASKLLIENSEEVARRMAEHSGKPVLCLAEGKIIQPGLASLAMHDRQRLARVTLKRCKRFLFLAMPEPVVTVIGKAYRKLFR
ncbi:MAG: phosphoribosyltransferase [Halomonas sp.]|uniref:phosphoribosyltransferase family protein n=1 Tax=Halomonas sp. TaxID=1486246 RepID=UPI001A10103D|nr:phosphoribosyltransferase family protein [Halomonas sp.]MBE0489379.1 phosphoribosyltransferase [Halomonas sp.]